MLQRLAAGGLQGENTPATADDLSAPILARMNASEHAALSFGGGAPAGESWGAPSSLSLGGQGAGWAGAAGGILHQVQRLTARQADSPAFSGAATASFGGSMSGSQGSGAAGDALADSGFSSPGNLLGGTTASTASAGMAAVQRAGLNIAGGSAYGAAQRIGAGADSAGGFGLDPVQRGGIPGTHASAERGQGYPTYAGVQRAGIPGTYASANVVQRMSAGWAHPSTSIMSLSGHGHGLAAMTGGLAARTLGPAAIQRRSAGSAGSYDASYAPASGVGFSSGAGSFSVTNSSSGGGSSSGAGFSAGGGFSPQSTTRTATGAADFARATILQRFAAGESGGAALGAALLGRMSGTGEAGWSPISGQTLAGGAGGIAGAAVGAAGSMSARIQRMAGSGSIGAGIGAGPSIDLNSSSGSFAGESSRAHADGSANLGSSIGSYGVPAGIGGSDYSGIGGGFAGLPAVQRTDPATWTTSGSQALVGQGYGLAAMSGGLTTRALQAGGSGPASSVQRMGSAANGPGGFVSNQSVGATRSLGSGSAWSAALPLQRFATSAAIGQAAAGAAQRLAATPVLLGGGRTSSGELAGGAPTVMVSRMWSGQPVGGAMTDDTAPGAAGPNGSPVPGLSEMTQRAQGTSAMLVFNGITADETAASNSRSGGAPALPVSRAMAMPPSAPAQTASGGRVLVQRASSSLAPAIAGETTLAGRSLVVPPPVQRAVNVDEVSATSTGSSGGSSDSSSSSAHPGTDLPKDMETLIDTVIKRLKRQLTLDHERAGGFHTSLLR